MAVIEIIEDEAVLGRNVARALQADGHSVHLSATGVGDVSIPQCVHVYIQRLAGRV